MLVVAACTILALGHFADILGRSTDAALRLLDPRRPPIVDEAGLALTAEYCLRSNDDNAVIFLGDSACHDGIDPEIFARLTDDIPKVERLDIPAQIGLRSYNLGTQQGTGPTGMLVILGSYLAKHPKPRLVVFCVSPFCFERSSGSAGGDLPERFTTNYGPEADVAVPWHQSIPYFIKHGTVRAWASHDRSFLDQPLVGMEKETFNTLRMKMSDARGFFALAGEHGPQHPIDPAPEKLIHDDWERGVREIAAACKEAGVPLLIRFAPISADAQRSRDFSPLDNWAAGIESPNVTVARPIVLAYEPHFMWDAIHLNSAGVAHFAHSMAKDVRDALRK